jgi:hypothetical protein
MELNSHSPIDGNEGANQKAAPLRTAFPLNNVEVFISIYLSGHRNQREPFGLTEALGQIRSNIKHTQCPVRCLRHRLGIFILAPSGAVIPKRN